MPVLVEYEATRVRLQDRDLDFLLDLVSAKEEDGGPKLLESITPTRESQVYLLRSGPFVGRVGLPGGDFLELRSRFPFSDVLELIRLSARRPVRIDTLPVPSDPGRSLVDVIATAFAREVERLAGGGLAKGYVRRRFENPPYPGSIDVGRHLGRFAARPDRLCTKARRITRDIDLNQILLVALEALRRSPLSPELGPRLDRLAPVFAEVSWTAVSAERVSRLELSGPRARYREALGLAEVILRSASLSPIEAGLSGAGVVYSMPKVWERYVERCVREAWPDRFEVEGSYGFDLTSTLRAEADVVVRDGDSIVALYDAKYKWIDRAPARADVYQMVTYCERLGLPEATLVYPGEPGRRTLVVGGRSIHTVGLEGPTAPPERRLLTESSTALPRLGQLRARAS